MLERGAGFWLGGTGSNNNPATAHLYCVLTVSCVDGLQLVVNLSTVRAGVHHDSACILQAGDHVEIKHESYAYYAYARTIGKKVIETARFGNAFRDAAPFSEEILQRLGEGLMNSDHATPKIQKYWIANKDRR